MSPFNREQWARHYELTSSLRTGYIEQTIQIEDWLDRIIQSIITPNDGSGSVLEVDLLRTVVLQDHAVSFDSKIRFLRRIGKITDESDYAPLASRLEKVRDNRNMLAHTESDFVSGEDDAIAFVRLKPNGDYERKILTIKDIDDMNQFIADLESDMFHLYTDLNPWLSAE